MHKKVITSLAIFMAFVFTLRAQDTLAVDSTKYGFKPHMELGVIAGPMWNRYDVTPIFNNFLYEDLIGGFNVGASFLWQPLKWIGIRTDLTLIDKTHVFLYYEGFSYNVFNDFYLQLPVMADLSWTINRFRIHADLGLFFGCFAASYYYGAFSDGPHRQNYSYFEFDRRSTKRFEMGYAATLGFGYRICPRLRISAEGTLFYGLTDTYDASPVSPNPAFNTTLGVQAGLHFVL